jgi:radical SAM superfamily enzyme YgiQ (UPF0313 family)
MRVFLVYVRDMNFARLVPESLRRRLSPDSDKPWVMGFPPLGILMLSSVLKRAGHDVRLYDTAHPRQQEADIARDVEAHAPDLVGLSFLSTCALPQVTSLATAIKARCPSQTVATGGVFATMNAVNLIQAVPALDYVCRGEGEELILDLLANLDRPARVPGIAWRAPGGRSVLNPPRAQIADLDALPFPDRESLDLEFLESMPLDVPAILSLKRWTTMQTSRGCPYPCTYCDIPSFNEGKWRDRSPAHVIAEYELLQRQGYGSCYLTDDHFLLKRKRIEAICTGFIERGATVTWGCEGRVDSLAIEEFPLMAKAGCQTLMFGIESGSQRVLDRLRKEQTLDQITHATEAAKDAGIEFVHGFFLIGNPGETEAEMLETFDFAARLRIDTFGFNRLCVYRGTPLWHEYVQRGLIDDAADWNRYFKCSDVDPTVLEGEKIHAIRKQGFMRLFMYRLRHRPLETLRLLRRFSRHMRLRDVVWILVKPFFDVKATRRPELPAAGSKALGQPREVGGPTPLEALAAPRGRKALQVIEAASVVSTGALHVTAAEALAGGSGGAPAAGPARVRD